MNKYSSILSHLLSSLLLILGLSVHATPLNSLQIQAKAHKEIDSLYQAPDLGKTLNARIASFSAYFLGRPYQLGPLGEGARGLYDQDPKYRSDVFDCTTFVETVMALSLARNVEQFQQVMDAIRYKDAKVSFITRNHFTSLDWNKNNAKRLLDTTTHIKDSHGKAVFKWAQATIDKPAWYSHFTKQSLHLSDDNQGVALARLKRLKTEARTLPILEARIPYLPLSTLFPAGKPDAFFFKQIPHGAIIEIVRPNWSLKKQIGTNLNVSHLGFGLWINDQLVFREASQSNKKVSDTLLSDYLKKYLNSPTVKGINIQVLKAYQEPHNPRPREFE